MATPVSQLAYHAKAVRSAIGTPALALAERVAAIAGLALVAPLVIGACAAVRILSGRSPLVAHQRIGHSGAILWLLKIRTMWGSQTPVSSERWIEHLPDTYVPLAKGAADPRVTSRMAAMLRRYSIDELPQLIHVAAGRMSFVGPRPLTRRELDKYYGPEATVEVLSVPPGLTGLWQVMGRNRLTYSQRKRLDLFWVRRSGLGLYARVLLATPARVVLGRDAW